MIVVFEHCVITGLKQEGQWLLDPGRQQSCEGPRGPDATWQTGDRSSTFPSDTWTRRFPNGGRLAYGSRHALQTKCLNKIVIKLRFELPFYIQFKIASNQDSLYLFLSLISCFPIKLCNILEDPLAVSQKMTESTETCSRV